MSTFYIAHAYKTLQPDDLGNSMIFELLGFDILLDHKCRPWLLEVNSSPSFTTDTPLDKKIKKGLIADTFKLINLNESNPLKYYFYIGRKHAFKKQQQDSLMTRMTTGKQTKLTIEERNEIKLKNEYEREKFECNNMGKYILLYPLNEKVKSTILAKNKTEAEQAEENKNDYLPDQLILYEETNDKEKNENKKKSYKKQNKEISKAKSVEFDGDIYKKFLDKANMIWEDFTTGK